MRLIGQHHNIAALGQHGEGIFILPGHKLLNRGKNNAARWAIGQHLPQRLARVGLHRLLAQQVLGQAEHAKQLPIQVIAVGNHHNRRVLQLGLLQHPRGKAGHGDALARALRVPHHPTLAAHRGGRIFVGRLQHPRNRRTHRVVLVVARHFFHQAAIVFKQHAIAQVVQQNFWCQHTANQCFQLAKLAQRVNVHSIYRAPLHIALTVG